MFNEGSQDSGGANPPALDGGDNPPATPGGETPPAGGPASFTDWIKAQPEAIRKLYEEHAHGLESALSKERAENRDLQKELKAIGAKLEEGSEAKTRLEALSVKMEQADSRADFYEEAVQPAIGVTNPKLAWLAVQDAPDEFMKRGRVDWESLKKAHPELFKTQTTRSDAGRGTQQPPLPGASMDDFIRNRAGKR